MTRIMTRIRPLVVAVLVLAAPMAGARAHAQTTVQDSIRADLSSADWSTRHRALQRISKVYPSSIPAALIDDIIRTINEEVAISRERSEDYGEYVMELVVTVARTDDPRGAAGVIRLSALGVSSPVGLYVAKRGSAVFPLLDSLLLSTISNDRSDATEVFAMMLGRFASSLSRADSARILNVLLSAAADASASVRLKFAFVVERIPLPDAVPVLLTLATSDPYQSSGSFLIRQEAAKMATTLSPLWSAQSNSVSIGRLGLAVEGACTTPSGAMVGHCQALSAFIQSAAQHVSANQPQPALAALASIRDRAALLLTQGLITRPQADFIAGNAARVIERLGGT